MEPIVTVKMSLINYERVRKSVRQYESRVKAAREHARRKYQYSIKRNNEHKTIKMITTGMEMGSFEELMNQHTCPQCQQTQAPTCPHAEEGLIINQSGPL
jgi:hypothetical protein